MTHSEPTPTPPSERTTHPKRLAHQAAEELHTSGELPDPQQLRAASPYDREAHDDTKESIKTKTERFAIEAHFIKQIVDKSITGEGDQVRLVKLNSPESFRNDLAGLKYDIEVFDMYGFKQTAAEVCADGKNAAALERLKTIMQQIAPSNTLPMYMDDSAEATVGDISRNIADRAIELIRMVTRNAHNADLMLDADQLRRLCIHNISLLESVANVNRSHVSQYLEGQKEVSNYGSITKTFPFDGTAINEVAQTLLEPDGDTYKIKITNVAIKPKNGLFGATVGCPAGFTFEDGDSAIRKLVTAIINEAYDRGLFEPAHQQYEPERQ